MGIKVFLDTNIILDILDLNRATSKEAVQIFGEIKNKKVIGYIAESVITKTDYILQKHLTLNTRVALFNELLQMLAIVPCHNAIVMNALQNTLGDLEDSILFELSVSMELDYFITNDQQAHKKLGNKKLPVVSSKNFLKLIK
jgi:predicted nucleic-acid-binding protein